MKYLVEYYDDQSRFRTTEIDAKSEAHIPFALKKAGRKINKVSKTVLIGESASKTQTELTLATK
jgi:hypothetical protein